MTAGRRRLVIDATPLAADRLTGVGRVLLSLVRALDERAPISGVELSLVVPASERTAVLRHGFASARVVGVPLPGRLWSLLTRLPLAPGIDRLLGRATYFFPNYRNWPLAHSRSITFVHDACFAVMPELVPSARRALLAHWVPRWLGRSDLVATGSRSAADELTTTLGIDPERLLIVPTTIERAVFQRPSQEHVRATAERHGLERFLLFVGSIERRKNLATLVSAYAAAERPTGHRLLLVGGDGWDNADVHRAMAAALASGADVRIADEYVGDDELPALLAGADALAMPSWHEGFGLPALEALACGTRVLAADIPGLREALAGNEESAVFLDPADVSAWTRAIEREIASPRDAEPAVLADWSASAAVLEEATLVIPHG
ncbi:MULTISPECIES: glycosyltransferase family 4 protein [unclassified Rathayibacter]|uniref:glycosyltransferase family 4 protein n=1 Tax=unclassified Rathayibacter TaxID=2609250 RepID=UPI00188A0FAB|nr:MULTISPECIES: glycosyltransferase family 1 protein [unclassified Rathayibacter]MBF4463343.1 glycosyltransferase family 4 protein [Rathayibacter sp. VKM Ac-2879]MBF4504934.1 glycosyltransferase family 4 protein [Rathayibacter sp. VKM Ac-2878]